MSNIIYSADECSLVKGAPSSSRGDIVFIHGAGSSPKTFYKVAKSFFSYFDLKFFINNSGKNVSQALASTKAGELKISEISLSLWADDLKQFLEEHRIQKAHFITHSFGARILAEYISIYSTDKILSITVEDMDFERRKSAQVDKDPLNYPAALSSHKCDIKALDVPLLVLSADRELGNSGITQEGVEFYNECQKIMGKRFRYRVIGSSHHSIHKSQADDFIREVFNFLYQQSPDLRRSKEVELISLKDIVKDPALFSFYQEGVFLKIKSLKDLIVELKKIWNDPELTNREKLIFTRFYEYRSDLLAETIYGVGYWQENCSIKRGKILACHLVTQLEWVLLTKGNLPVPGGFYYNNYCSNSAIVFFGKNICLDYPLDKINKVYLEYFLHLVQGYLPNHKVSIPLLDDYQNALNKKSFSYESFVLKESSDNLPESVFSKPPLNGLYDLIGNVNQVVQVGVEDKLINKVDINFATSYHDLVLSGGKIDLTLFTKELSTQDLSCLGFRLLLVSI